MSITASAIGNAADLREGQVLLPGFVSHRDAGLFVDLQVLDSRGLMVEFVERVFRSGARFAGLDYELFLKLLFLWEPADIDRQVAELTARGLPAELRLAGDIVAFPQERREIYRGVKVLDAGAAVEYIFERISVEREIDDAAAPGGKRTVAERLYADFDEFVAALWEKDVRFGIDAKAVRDAIAGDSAERLLIARSLPPKNGKDAGIDEQTDLLHRDDAPRLLPNGRMDLHHYRNRFPQVRQGTRLFRKVPRIAGISGWDVTGKELAPTEIKDFDIATLAGPGTEVVRDAGSECVVAASDGFLDIDAQSGQISVIAKIVSREGVSMRTTGDLVLSGDEYEEHGEVQEKRSITGRNMTFFADVFGNIISDGGRITLKRNLGGGSLQAAGGEIVVEGGASRATLEAPRGSVTLNRAENCRIVAARVHVARAVNCDIVADEIEVEVAEGSAIAARHIVVGNATPRRDEATTIAVLLPDTTRLENDRKGLGESRTAAEAQVAKFSAALQALTAQPDIKSYLSIQPKVAAKTLVMSAAQQAQWQALLARIAPTLRQLAACNAAIQKARQQITEKDAEIAALDQARREASRGLYCRIETVSGDTVVHTLRQSSNQKPLADLLYKELHKRLREPGDGTPRLFFGSSGSFEWRPPEDAPAAEAPASGQD